MEYSRRDLSMLLPAIAAATANAQTPKKTLEAKVYKYEDLPVKVNGQNESRAVLNMQTHGGFPVELHMTKLGPGQTPHAPHKHPHEEIMMLKSGVIDATFNGQTTRLGPGSIISMASNVEHGWKNPGPDSAEYFVIALGNENG